MQQMVSLRFFRPVLFAALLFFVPPFVYVAESDYEQGQQALERGDYQQAIMWFRSFVESQPNGVGGYTYLGYALSQLGQYGDAIESYQQALRLEPHSQQAHLGLGYIAYRQGRFDDAIQFYQIVVDTDGLGATEAYHNLGRIFAERGEVETAIDAQQSALARNPAFTEAHYHLGVLYSRQRKWEQAIESFNAVMDAGGARPETYYQLARCYKQIGDDKAASAAMSQFRHLKSVESVFQHHLEAILLAEGAEKNDRIFELGITYIHHRRYSEAIAQFQRLIDREPEVGRGYHLLGKLYTSEGEMESAEQHFRRSIELNSKGSESYHELAYLYGQGGRNLEEAVALAQKACALSPATPQYLNTLSWLLYKLGRYDEAEDALQKAIELRPDERLYRDGLAEIRRARAKN